MSHDWGQPPIPRGTTRYTRCGRGRTTYDPVWSASRPWSVVVDGTVFCYASDIVQAEIKLRSYGCKALKEAT
jgi:hypothetical protein